MLCTRHGWSMSRRAMCASNEYWCSSQSLGVFLSKFLRRASRLSGVTLCRLVNCISPGCCVAPSESDEPFVMMENIGNYLSACTALGMAAHDSFQTVDLYEGKNMNAVIGQIHRLGSLASQRGFTGPSLGVKMATENKREFTEAQLMEAKGTTTFLGKGSHGTPGSEMKTSEVGCAAPRAAHEPPLVAPLPFPRLHTLRPPSRLAH